MPMALMMRTASMAATLPAPLSVAPRPRALHDEGAVVGIARLDEHERLLLGIELRQRAAEITAADGLLAREARRPGEVVFAELVQGLIVVACEVGLLLRLEVARIAVEDDLAGELPFVLLDVLDLLDLDLDREAAHGA